MILADKIIELRKKSGWSQEELAEKLNVTRQSISKWEGAQSTPDLNKILAMSQLFGVSTDYLLKDEQGEVEYIATEEQTPARKVSMEEANAYLAVTKRVGKWIALGVALCIASPICLILLAGQADAGRISEGFAVAIGMLKACEIGQKLGVTPDGTKERIQAVLEKWHLPTTTDLPMEELYQTMLSDKKKLNGKVYFVVLKEIGDAKTCPLSEQELKDLL